MNDIHKVRISFVQPHVGCVAFKERTCGVQTCDPTEILQLLPHKPGDMGPQGEANQVGVVVDVNARLRAYLLYEGSNLNISRGKT